MSRPLFKDLGKVLKEKFKFFQHKDFSSFKYKINYKNLLQKIENLSKVIFTSASDLTESFIFCSEYSS